MITRGKIKTMSVWEYDPERIYDFIYIVPTSNKDSSNYNTWYYIWQVWDEIKIITSYDCWSFSYDDTRQRYYSTLNFDFEWVHMWIKLWSNNIRWWIKFSHWQITAIEKPIDN